MLSRRRALLELSPSRLSLCEVAGRSVLARREVRHECSSWSSGWAETLRSLEAPLAAMVSELELKGATATVLVQSPSAVFEVASCPVKAGRASALSAARLALDAAGVDAGVVRRPTGVAVFATDRAGADGTPPHFHTLAWSDDDSRMAAVAEWTARAGLAPADTIVLADAPLMVHAALEVLSAQAGRTVLWMDEHQSVLAGAARGRLCFVRLLPIGLESLVEAVAHAPGADGKAAALSLDDSRAVLSRIGIPDRDQIVDAARGIVGKSLLPSIQPVLQRLCVEIKQTIRFGLSESDRETVTVELAGPGALIPRLAEAIATLTGHSARPVGDQRNAAAGLIGLALAHPLIGRLSTIAADEERDFRRARRLLHAGIAAAFALVGIDAAFTAMDAHGRPAPDPVLVARLAAAEQAREALDRAAGPLKRFDDTLAQVAPSDAHWRPFLESLAAATPPEVRFEAVRTDDTVKDASVVRLSGRVSGPNAAESARSVRDILAALEALPIVEQAQLISTGRATINGSEVQRFEIACEFLGLPRFSFAASEGEEP